MTTLAPWQRFHARDLRGKLAVEFKLQAQVAQMLEQHCLPTWRYTHLPFGKLRAAVTAGRLKAAGVTRGWPDFLLIGPRRTCFLELKSGKGRVSREQSDLAAHLMVCGCGYGLTNDFEDAVQMLKDWGALPATVQVT